MRTTQTQLFQDPGATRLPRRQPMPTTLAPGAAVRTVLLSYGLGAGHKQVADLLAAELAPLGHVCEHRPLEEWVPRDYDLIFRRGYLFVAVRMPALWDAMYRSPFFAGRGALAPAFMRERPVRRFEARGFARASLVVTTQYNAMEIAADWKRSTRSDLRLAAVVTDYDIYPLWARPEVDLYLVPHEDLKARLVRLGVPDDRVLATGIPIDPAFEGLTRDPAVRASLGLFGEARVAMVFGGGGGMGPMERAVRECLSADGWSVIAVCGKNVGLQRRLERLALETPGRLVVLGYRRDIPQLMAASDAIITKGGALSLTEAAHSGARTIALSCLPGQERENVAFMERRGWAERCDDVRMLGRLLEGHTPKDRRPQGLPPSPARTAALALDSVARW